MANKNFLNRTLEAIVGIRFGVEPNQEKIEKGTKRLMELLPQSLHDRIDPIRKNTDLSYLKPFLRQ